MCQCEARVLGIFHYGSGSALTAGGWIFQVPHQGCFQAEGGGLVHRCQARNPLFGKIRIAAQQLGYEAQKEDLFATGRHIGRIELDAHAQLCEPGLHVLHGRHHSPNAHLFGDRP